MSILASSSTNKQPLLIDRPLHETAIIGGVAGLSSATNLNTPIASGLVSLVDCTGNDGAVLDSVSILITESGTTQSIIVLFLGDGSTLSYVCGASIPGGNTIGDRIHASLPPLSVPVPNLASPAATVDAYPSEIDKKNTGLLIPAGRQLFVGVSAALSAPSAATRVVVSAQGGYY